MNVDELVEAIAERFGALGANPVVAEYHLKSSARGQCIRILDKYSRFTPVREIPSGFLLDRTFKDGSEYVAEVSIDAADGAVRAAVVRYDPE